MLAYNINPTAPFHKHLRYGNNVSARCSQGWLCRYFLASRLPLNSESLIQARDWSSTLHNNLLHLPATAGTKKMEDLLTENGKSKQAGRDCLDFQMHLLTQQSFDMILLPDGRAIFLLAVLLITGTDETLS